MPAPPTLAFLQASTTAASHWGLTAAEWITIAAIILGPIFAVVTQFVWERIRKERQQKLAIFSTLMTLRGSALSQDYVKALNFIDVVFYKNEAVRAKWKTLLGHLASDAYKVQPIQQTTLERTRDLQAELLVEMAKDLGFDYDFTHIKGSGYYPQALVTVDTDMFALRKMLIAALSGSGSLSVRAVEDPPLAEQGLKVRQTLAAVLEGKSPLAVKLVEEVPAPAMQTATPIIREAFESGAPLKKTNG